MKVNSSLPITAFKGEILESVAGNPVVIITAETGAGKSTQVPQYLLDTGYSVLVTQPRRLAVYTVSERVSEEYGCELGSVVGYKTSRRSCYNSDTMCLFVTDGLAMVRELLGQRRQQILVIDEVHEWNTNIETLVAWAKHQISKGADFKLVLMSATLEAEKLSVYFGGAPIISVPGRTYPVEEVMSSVAESAYQAVLLLKRGMNVLLFEAGKREIANSIYSLEKSGVVAEIIPLHGELEPAEQAKAFRSYGRPKCIVATNVAQTSITVPDIDAVVDSGLERRIEVVDGVEARGVVLELEDERGVVFKFPTGARAERDAVEGLCWQWFSTR
jgi:HrpA-like RNA helicase